MQLFHLSGSNEEAPAEVSTEAEGGIDMSTSTCNSEAASPLLLMEWWQKKPTKTEGLKKIQSYHIIPKCPGFNQKSLVPRTRKIFLKKSIDHHTEMTEM